MAGGCSERGGGWGDLGRSFQRPIRGWPYPLGRWPSKAGAALRPFAGEPAPTGVTYSPVGAGLPAKGRAAAPKSQVQQRPLAVHVAHQDDRYEDRVRPNRSASRYWVRSRAVILALATLSR
ncbi:MAG: hypothetical protein EOP15_09430 [Pseudomonas sp.]|nr:MAG: hypothetical protein EOP15_09430 [Pseudomonas sp.]